jgi:hypothetical protein
MYSNKKGWYKIKNISKFIIPIDEHMCSYKDGFIQYKSSLEKNAIIYFDKNPNIIKFSLEPFPIKYIKPTDNKIHRYYIDFYVEFKNKKFLIEVKPYKQLFEPIKPLKNTKKAQVNYKKSLMTWAINLAKWKAAKEFCLKNNMEFIFLTEKHLNC